jgi:GT2 family glycosyltransferase
MDKKFSVVIATFNNVDLLRELIPRLTGDNLIGEVVIVDDGSSDATWEYLNSICVTSDCDMVLVHNEKNTGVIAPRNQGLKLATREYTIILDDDQRTSRVTLGLYAKALEKCDIVGYIPGRINHVVGAVVVAPHQPFNHVGEGGMCMKTALWKELDYFDMAFSPAYREGPDIQLRAIQKGKKIGCVLGARMIHFNNTTLGRGDHKLDLNQAGCKSHQLIMSRINAGYYGGACDIMGKYYRKEETI